MNAAARGAGVRAGGAASATGCAPCARCSSASASPTTPSARSTRSPSRSTGPTPTRRSSRSATACSPTASRSTSRTPASSSWARSRSSSSPSTTRAAPGSRRRSSSSGEVDEDERATISAALAERRGAGVEVRAAERGDKRRILELAERNALLALDQERLKAERTRQQRVEALDELQRELSLDVLPLRIECFDISNLMGTHTVASMVVFEGGAPKKSDYRRFTIRSLEEGVPDDFAAMREVLTRRLAQLGEPARPLSARSRLQRVVRRAAQRDRDRRRQGPARRRPRGAAGLPRARRRGRLARQADRGGLRSGPRGPDRARRTTRRRSSCCSACATRRTASRSPTTARAATGR